MIEAPSSFNGFLRKIFINDEDLSLNTRYISKIQSENMKFDTVIISARFTMTTAEGFRGLYVTEITRNEKFYIIIDTLNKGLFIYYNYFPSQIRECFISLELLRDYIRKNNIMAKKNKKDDSIKSRSELLELED